MTGGDETRQKRAPVTVLLEPDELAELRAHARDLDRKYSWIVRKAVLEYLERQRQAAAGGAS